MCVHQELIQNAEDAGASVVQVVSDQRVFHQQLDPATARSHPHLAFLRVSGHCAGIGSLLALMFSAETDRDSSEKLQSIASIVGEAGGGWGGNFLLGSALGSHVSSDFVLDNSNAPPW